MNGLPYYKAYPRDFIEGTIGMDFELKGAYRLVLDLIYMQGGNLPDDARYIAGQLGCSVKKWNGLRDKLIAAGKIEVRGAYLGNDRADKELQTLGKLQDKQRENRSRPNKNKELESPRFDHTEPDTDTDIPEANASGRDASILPPADDPDFPKPSDDFAKDLFDRTVTFLGRHGIEERQARSILGRWRKTSDDAAIFDACLACSKSGAVDPIPWITARLSPKSAPTPAITDNVMRLLNEQLGITDERKVS